MIYDDDRLEMWYQWSTMIYILNVVINDDERFEEWYQRSTMTIDL